MARGDVVEQPSISDLVHQLATDAREFASAEVAVAKAKALDRVGRYRTAGIYFGIAAVLGMAALPALLVGLIMTLTPLVGAGFATLIVIGLTLVLAGVIALIGKSRLAPSQESPR